MKRKKPKTISLRDYASRRGVSVEAVSKAITTGRLRESVVTVGGQPKIRDAAVADREWALNTRQRVDQPPPGAIATERTTESQAEEIGDDDPPDYYVSRARREAAAADREVTEAALAAIELAETKGELLPAAGIEERLKNVFSSCKTKLLGVPARARQRDPSLSVEQIVLFEDLLREALEDLAGPPGSAAPM